MRVMCSLALDFRTGPLPHPATQQGIVMGGRVGERAGADALQREDKP